MTASLFSYRFAGRGLALFFLVGSFVLAFAALAVAPVVWETSQVAGREMVLLTAAAMVALYGLRMMGAAPVPALAVAGVSRLAGWCFPLAFRKEGEGEGGGQGAAGVSQGGTTDGTDGTDGTGAAGAGDGGSNEPPKGEEPKKEGKKDLFSLARAVMGGKQGEAQAQLDQVTADLAAMTQERDAWKAKADAAEARAVEAEAKAKQGEELANQVLAMQKENADLKGAAKSVGEAAAGIAAANHSAPADLPEASRSNTPKTEGLTGRDRLRACFEAAYAEGGGSNN